MKGLVLVQLLQYLFLLTGVALMARPSIHAIQRQWGRWQAHSIWSLRNAGGPMIGSPSLWIRHESGFIDSLVLYSDLEEDLTQFPCQMPADLGPPDGRLVVILGHRDAHFRGLEKTAQGDGFAIETVDEGVKRFTVSRIDVIAKESLDHAVRSFDRPGEVVLVTCYPFRFTGPAPMRYLVWLKKDGTS